ncbi:hypothetical protein [Virgibacillus ihumii]|uniref:hypothetical protein n=1 Tax=Virgibacillus ihumii TaxID=2686091 RepID=UPI00157C0A77|nr:hypothetical protein [Virgibacillus ihumii]
MNHIKEVILHVGLSKTGTSSIQSTLYNEGNNKLLLKEGILYPRCWEQSNHGNILLSPFSTNPETVGPNKFPKILSKEEIEEKDKLNLNKFETALSKCTANKLIISGEVISSISRENIGKLKKYLMDIGFNKVKFKIMIYTRNPVTWAVSTIQQQFKYGDQYDTVLKIRKNRDLPTLFQDKIGKFIDIFGKDSVYVYPFEEARTHEMGMVGHLLEELNIDKKVINNIKQIRTNESMSMFTGEFLTYINYRIPLIIDGKQNGNRHISDHQPLLKIGGNKFDISLEEKKKIAKVTQHDIGWLKESYGIDYTYENLKETKIYENIDTSFKDIEKIYPNLTKTIRDSLVEFMENKLISEIPFPLKDHCFELIMQFKEQEQDLIRIDHVEDRFQSKLNTKGVNKGVIYRELALLMEGYDQIKIAKLFMGKAGLYLPNGPFIKKKHEEYKQKLLQQQTINESIKTRNEIAAAGKKKSIWKRIFKKES